jgi:hypothetical protein
VCAGEHTLHGLSARRASYMELVRYFLVNEELSRYCWALLYKRKLKQSVKNKFFHPVLVTYGPLILYYYLTQPATYKKKSLDVTHREVLCCFATLKRNLNNAIVKF